MAHAELCPVCQGAGFKLSAPEKDGQIVGAMFYTCNGCRGAGWIAVTDVDAMLTWPRLEDVDGFEGVDY